MINSDINLLKTCNDMNVVLYFSIAEKAQAIAKIISISQINFCTLFFLWSTLCSAMDVSCKKKVALHDFTICFRLAETYLLRYTKINLFS